MAEINPSVNREFMPRSALHEAARAYGSYGWPIFPITPGAKTPLTKNGFKGSSTDLNQIDVWWTQWPDANIGLDCGAAKIGVIDVDQNDSLRSLPELPRTFTVATPRGGKHAYFLGSCRSSASKLAPGVDTRGIGGYTLLPPSMVDGKQYVEISDAECATIPGWINERLTAENAPRQGQVGEVDWEETSAFMAQRRQCVKGERNDWTYKTAAELADRGVGEDDALRLLTEWNERNTPPLEPDEISLACYSGYRNRQNPIGIGPSGEPPRRNIDMTKFAKVDEIAAKRNKFHVFTEAEQDALPEPVWLIPDILPDRTSVALLGASGHHKSTLAVDINLSVATGVPIFGRTALRQGWVAYGALEGKDGIGKFRRPAWRLHHGHEGEIKFGLMDAPRMAFPGEFEEFIKAIDEKSDEWGGPPALITIDTMLKSMVGWKADEQGSSLYIDKIEALIYRYDCSVISIVHPGKDASRGILGSQNFVNGLDSHLKIEFDEDTSVATFTVLQHKDFSKPMKSFYLDVIKVGPGMVLRDRISAPAHKESPYSGARVGAALEALKAKSGGSPVRLRVLAIQMTPRLEADDEDAYEQEVRKTERALRKSSQGSLAPYVDENTNLWRVPDVD